ncbi:MAG: damage-inducible mutagenesis protein [Alphaproteobacteria bacterium]|nr:damage-inducible mutagenesis protein [Alphaproteobacteria bacterium]
MASSRRAALADLRAHILRVERGGAAAAAHGALALGVAAIDGVLPGGGLARGAMHEATGTAAAGFVAMIAGKLSGPVLWCVPASSQTTLYGPGLAALGLDAGQLVVVHCGSRDDMLWAMEEGLRDPALAAVVGEPDRPVALTASRRLQLAAETAGVAGLILCREAGADGLAPSAVFSRWQVDCAPGLAAAGPARNGVRWRLGLRRCRGGVSVVDRTWMVEWCDATGNLALVSGTGDRPAAARYFKSVAVQ